jgi:acyl-coenzyme A synthetase/AMP-(fatty) acid ligase
VKLEGNETKADGVFWRIEPSEAVAFIKPDLEPVTYEEFHRLIEVFSARLSERKGLVGICCDGHFSQYVAYISALRCGVPAVLMQPGQTAESTGLTLGSLYVPATDDLVPVSSTRPPVCHEDLAVLLSTSGSTGAEKWVRLSYANLAANAASIAEYLSLAPNDCAPMSLPLQYSYGMSVLNSHLAVGATLALSEGSVVSDDFWAFFKNAGCTSFAGVPHSFQLMDQAKVRTDHLGRLRYMTQAGGRLAPESVLRWAKRSRSEGWDFFVMYGQTEAAPRISYLPPEYALQSPSAVGIPVPGGEIRIADDTGAPVPDGETGELIYIGANTMMGYALEDADLAKPQGTNELRTGDIARRLPNGMYEIVGRRSRFVKMFGLRISLDEVEKKLESLGVSAVCGSHEDRMHVLVETGDAGENDLERVRRELVAWLELPENSFSVVSIDAVPRRRNGKVDTAAVEKIIAREYGVKRQDRSGDWNFWRAFGKRRTVAEIFRMYFGPDLVAADSTFQTLGGDSLTYLSLSLELEQILGRLPKKWETLTIAQLQDQAIGVGWVASIETATLARALAIMAIVSTHLNFFDYGGGGAFTLFVVAGMSFAAFTLPDILSKGDISALLSLFFRIAGLTLTFILFGYVVTGRGEWPAFLLISNYMSPETEGSVWFVEVYLQTLIVLGCVLSFRSVRGVLQRHASLVVTMAAAGLLAVTAISDALVDLNHLYRRLPHLLAWQFCLGLAIAFSKTWMNRAVLTGLLAFGHWQYAGYGLPSVWFFPICVLLLIWCPEVPVPHFMRPIIRMVAGASLVIYLSHFQIAALVEKLVETPEAWLVALVALAGGVLLWRLYHPMDLWMNRRLRVLFAPARWKLSKEN